MMTRDDAKMAALGIELAGCLIIMEESLRRFRNLPRKRTFGSRLRSRRNHR